MQYGSDAISGVTNLLLDRSIGTRAQVTAGIATASDGAYGEASFSSGMRVGGFSAIPNITNTVDTDTKSVDLVVKKTRVVGSMTEACSPARSRETTPRPRSTASLLRRRRLRRYGSRRPDSI